MKLLFSEDYRESLVDGSKTITIRKGDFREIEGKTVYTNLNLYLIISEVKTTTFNMVSDEDVKKDGFKNHEEFMCKLSEFYRGLKKSDQCSVIYFKLSNLKPLPKGHKGNTSDKRGKPTTQWGKAKIAMNKFKKGFYSDKFKPCLKCEDLAKCPYVNKVEGKEELFNPMFDEFGIQRCTKEILFFEKTKNQVKGSFEFLEADGPAIQDFSFLKVRLGRALKYMADKGVTQIRKMKDKEGKVHEIEMQNILHKGFYFDIKALRDSAQALKITRESREPQEVKHDIAIEFMNKGVIEQTKKSIEKGDLKITKEKKKISLS